MISPTIGRVVLVHREYSGSDQAEPALVSYVHHDRLINVGGFDQNGQPFAATNIMLLQDDDAAPEEGNWAEWMPYQKQAAAKSELGSVGAGGVPILDPVATQDTAQSTEQAPDPAPEPNPVP